MSFINSLRQMVHHTDPKASGQIDEIEKLSIRVTTSPNVFLCGAPLLKTDDVLKVFGERLSLRKVCAISLLDEPARLTELSTKHVAPAWLCPSEVMKHFGWSAWYPGIYSLLHTSGSSFWDRWAERTADGYRNLELLYVHETPTDDVPKKSVNTLLQGMYWAAVTHYVCSLVGGAPLLPPLGYLNLLEQCIPFGVVNNELIVLCA